jgi:hypothetical protein
LRVGDSYRAGSMQPAAQAPLQDFLQRDRDFFEVEHNSHRRHPRVDGDLSD